MASDMQLFQKFVTPLHYWQNIVKKSNTLFTLSEKLYCCQLYLNTLRFQLLHITFVPSHFQISCNQSTALISMSILSIYWSSIFILNDLSHFHAQYNVYRDFSHSTIPVPTTCRANMCFGMGFVNAHLRGHENIPSSNSASQTVPTVPGAYYQQIYEHLKNSHFLLFLLMTAFVCKDDSET